jgi:hypothetical protein
MSPPKVKPLGRPSGRGKAAVPRADYAALALLEAFGWPLFCIGQLWGIAPTSAGHIIKRWREA